MNQEKKCPKRQLGVLDLAHQFLRANVRQGDIVIDATCGRGNDTKLLCELTGESGRVIGFDIQQDAIDSAAKLLAEHGLRAELYLDSHANMEQYAEPESVSCIVFNFGWLPAVLYVLSFPILIVFCWFYSVSALNMFKGMRCMVNGAKVRRLRQMRASIYERLDKIL